MTILYHGGLWSGATLDDIDIFRLLSDERQENGSDYAGFYMTDDKEMAEGYAEINKGVVFKIEMTPDSRIVEYDGDITKIGQTELMELAKNCDVIYGIDPFGLNEYILLNKDAIKSFGEIGGDEKDKKAACIARKIMSSYVE